MKNMVKYAFTLALAGAVSMLASALQAQPAGGGRGGFGLDEQQRNTLREEMQKQQDAVQQLNEKLQAAQRELMKEVLAEKQDEKKIREKAEAVSKIQTDIMVLRAKAFASINPTLKPEQKEQMIENRFSFMMLQGGGMMGGPGAGMGMRPGGPGGQGGPGAAPGGPGGQGGRGQRGGGGQNRQ
jgi:Spy/CpxP family protein refolding chaperone